jgi:hypothetical protein
MHRIYIAAIVLLLWTDASRAADPPATSRSNPSQSVRIIQNEYDAKLREFSTKYQAAKTKEEQKKVFELYPEPTSYGKRMMEIAKANPKTGAARDALFWIVERMRNGTEFTEAIGMLAQDFATDTNIAKVLPRLDWQPAGEPLFRAVIEKNGDRKTQGIALYSLGDNLMQRAEAVSEFERAKAPANQIEQMAGKTADGKVRTAADLSKEAEATFQKVIDQYADVTGARGSIADRAKTQLFEMHNLAIGQAAPEISGETVDGKAMKLSDFKGKVVVLDFWGDW